MSKCLICGRENCKCCPRLEWNKKGSVQLYAFMLGLVVIILALALAFPTRQGADIAMNNTTSDSVGLSCTNASISNFDKIACFATDLTPMYFIGSLIFIGGVILLSKIVFE
jgi:beta-lactamase regulating signal transducer with metallopeptidase domain